MPPSPTISEKESYGLPDNKPPKPPHEPPDRPVAAVVGDFGGTEAAHTLVATETPVLGVVVVPE